MEQYNLLKLNGEYVKLYISTNPNLPRLVKNSGSLVVYHDLYSDINIQNNLYSIYNPLLEKDNNNNKYLKIYNRSKDNGDPYNNDTTRTIDFYNIGITGENGDTLVESPYFTDPDSKIIYNGFERINYNDLLNNKSNYLYLGNELIAGGWGFLNKTQRDLAIKELLYIPQWLNDLQDSIIQEQYSRKNQDYSLDSKFKNYVKKGSNIGASSDSNFGPTIDENINSDGFLYLSLADFDDEQFHFNGVNRTFNFGEGDVTQIINHDNLYKWATSNDPDLLPYKKYTQFLLKDLPKLFSNADYEDISITDIDFKLNLMFYSLIDYDSTSISKKITENIPYKIDRDDPNLIYVPIGSALHSINYKVDWETNDTSGIKNLSIQKINNLDNINYANIETISIKGIDEDGNEINVQNTVENNNSDSEEIHSSFIINFNYNDSTNLIKILPNNYNERIDILTNTYFLIGETPPSKYKEYPYLKDNDVSKILKSTQNVIKEHRYDIKPISIVPKYLIYFSKLQSFKIDDGNLDKINIDFTMTKNDNLKLNNHQLILDNEISIPLNFGNNELNYKLFVFALPTIYTVEKIILKKSNFYKNVTGLFKYISYIEDYSLDPTNYNSSMTGTCNLFFGIFSYHIHSILEPKEGENGEILTSIYNGEYELIITVKENNQSLQQSVLPSNKYITINKNDSSNQILSLRDTKLLNMFDINVFEKYVELLFNNDFESNHLINYNDNIFASLLKKINSTKTEDEIMNIYHSKLQPLYI